MEGALDDITVLDLGQVIAMPMCTMLLADMGARVIKVESRERGAERMALGIKRERNGKTERVHAAQYRERNKLGITLDLKQPAGVALFKELVETRRRRHRELQRRRDGAAGARLRGREAREPADRLRLHHRVRPGRALTRGSAATTCWRRRSAGT